MSAILARSVGFGRFAAVLLVALAACTAPSRHVPSITSAPTSVAKTFAVAPECRKPLPATAAGFAQLFSSLPPSEWGAADVSISVPMPDGRIVWLYGDTFSAGRFVHSTAIVQDRGCLHVSQRGAQLLPNDDAKHIYWISTARAVSSTALVITARRILLTGTCVWCFADGGLSRTALVSIDQQGDARFIRWTASQPGPAPDPGPMYNLGPHHFGYARHVHPEITLADGHHLVTTCQNWDDGSLHQFADYRPIFSG